MENPDNVIEVRNLRKDFRTHSANKSFVEHVVYHNARRTRSRNVLRDINFSVKRGESLGIIGRNGSGKSTMLKLLTRILRPTEGTIETEGKISCLIELGAGFHPDMTGRENIFINGSVFGLKNNEIKKRVDTILEFSELGEFIDERVRDYSTGMNLRLGFSIAINVDADILIIDEILAVGDIGFQKKCIDRIEEMKRNGTSLVIVTQSISQAIELCDKVLWIDNGVMREYGDPEKVCALYEKEMLG